MLLLNCFQVDAGSHLFDPDDSNNLGFTLATVLAAFSTDVAVDAVTSPEVLEYGESFTVEWVIRNEGAEDVEGYKCDTG